MPGGSNRVVGVVDYQAGNLQSIENAFTSVGARVVRVRGIADLAACTHLVLPGVGAFGFCAERLAASRLAEPLQRWAFEERRPMLGICVGMQLLGDDSEESVGAAGLGWIGGQIKRIAPSSGIRVPHVGWNSVRFEHHYGAFAAGEATDFYFDHSFAYHQPRLGHTVGYCTHGVRFSAVVRRENLVAVQFHPEKSQAAGLRLLTSFLAQ